MDQDGHTRMRGKATNKLPGDACSTKSNKERFLFAGIVKLFLFIRNHVKPRTVTFDHLTHLNSLAQQVSEYLIAQCCSMEIYIPWENIHIHL